MTDRHPTEDRFPDPEGSRWLPKTRLGKLGHLLFWTALFYGTTVGIARLCEWLSP